MTPPLHHLGAGALLYVVATGLLTLVVLRISAPSRAFESSPTQLPPWSLAAWLALPTVFAASLTISGIAHEIELGEALDACCQAVLSGAPAVFFGLAAAALATALGLRAYQLFTSISAPSAPTRPATDTCNARLTTLLSEPGFRAVGDLPIVAVREAPFAIASLGWFKQRVVVHDRFLRAVTPGQFHAALGHERAHVEARDPAVGTLLRVLVALNPWGVSLRPRVAQWLFARELDCDGVALRNGASRADLASAILLAARPAGHLPHCCAGLAVGRIDELHARVRLVLDADLPAPSTYRGGLLASGFALAVAIAAPHWVPEWTFRVHCLFETFLTSTFH